MLQAKKISGAIGSFVERHTKITALIIDFIFVALLWYLKVDFSSQNTVEAITNALNTTVVFVSIVIGFVGVLLTSLLDLKNKSDVIRKFFRLIKEDVFARAVKAEIISGITCSLFSIFSYIMLNTYIMCVVFAIWIWIVVYFSLSTFNLISNLLRLLLAKSDSSIDDKIDGKLDSKSSQELRNRFSK